MATLTATIKTDCAILEQQIGEAKALSQSSELFADEIKGYLGEMSDDLVIGEPVAATAADGTSEIVFTPRLGAKFERMISAFRASQADIINHNTTA